ncbi:MAG: PQQ-like beta-propeller repeat protein [Planctomycetes bacterium]|nr:PQQ-like beta-propeller repeat protein [Planctomycetota bacterium]
MSSPEPTAAPVPAVDAANQTVLPPAATVRGQWKVGAGIFVVACAAQSILWSRTWEDPTNFKMSVLFVWPAALFLLLIWWTFFSGWSARVRFGSAGAGIVGVVAFFSIFRLERFDGDMTPTRLSFRWTTSPDQKAQAFLQQVATNKVTIPVIDAPLEATEDDWTGFRGSRRDGVVNDIRLQDDWKKLPPKLIWRHPVGRAWSSFAVIGDYAFTQEQRDTNEAVVAYQLSSGKQLWEHLDAAQFPASDAQGGTGPRATPQFDNGNLFTLGATGILNCLEARSGKVVWTANILNDAGTADKPAPNLGWGMAGSPLIVDQMVIVNPGGTNDNSVVAYDKQTGKKIWGGGKHPATYASPSVATLCGETILLMPVGTGLVAYSLSDGKELWFFPWSNSPQVCGAMPVVVDQNSLLFGIGYGIGTVRLKVSRTDDAWTVTQQWHSNRFRPKFNDFVLYEGHAYGLDDGTLTCLNIDSGKVIWKSGRYGYGQVLLVDTKLLIVSEEGKVFQIPAEPSKPADVDGIPLLGDGITWNQPVLLHGRLLVRNAHEAACFSLE